LESRRTLARRESAISDVLLVDPESASDERIVRALADAHLHVRTASGGHEALKLAREAPPDLVIVELVLPDLSGIGLCRALRDDERLARVPIVMLTAQAAEMDRVVAFEVGVDDFVAKPCHPRELALRASAILRRTRQRRSGARAEGPLQLHALVVDPTQRSVRVGGHPIELTAKEFDVLVALMRHAGRVLSRQRILDSVWGAESRKTARVVDTHVKWIRRKLGPEGACIETLRGVGYRFTDAPDEGVAAGAV
jgi:two-component system phosphate regulon response regulator PhoB